MFKFLDEVLAELRLKVSFSCAVNTKLCRVIEAFRVIQS